MHCNVRSAGLKFINALFAACVFYCLLSGSLAAGKDASSRSGKNPAVDSLERHGGADFQNNTPSANARRQGGNNTLNAYDSEGATVQPIEWDGRSPVSTDSIYIRTPDQEAAFIRAYLKALVPDSLPDEIRKRIKDSFLSGLQAGMEHHVQRIDSLYNYRDSLYNSWKTIDIDSL